MSENRARVLTWANGVTLLRVALLPGFIMAFQQGGKWGYIIAMGFVVFFEVTDWFDGMVARATGQVSDVGKLLDPLADTLSRFTIFLTFLAAGVAPLWMIIILFFRDMIVAYIRVTTAMLGVVLSARGSGKLKAAIQGGGIFFVVGSLALYEWGIGPLPAVERDANLLFWHEVIWWLMLAVTAATAWSLLDYMKGLYDTVASKKNRA